MVRVSNPSEFPAGHKFMILIFSTSYIHHAADQRSIDAPGHGYGAYDEPVNRTDHFAVKDEEELQKELNTLYSRDKNRKDILVLEISRNVKVGVSVQVDF